MNASTSWSSTSLQVYTRASSCAWTRLQYAPFEVRVIDCTWTVARVTFIVFACLVLIPVKFAPFQHLTSERESAMLTHWAVFCGAFDYRNSRYFSLFALFALSTRLDPLMNKLLFSSLMIRWLRLSVLKTLLKRVLHVLRSTFLGQLLRILLHHFMAYLGQSCLSRPRPSVSQTPCTASWCQPDRLLYGLPKDRLCLSSGLYGFETWVHVGLSGYLCFRIYETLFIDTYNPFLLH